MPLNSVSAVLLYIKRIFHVFHAYLCKKKQFSAKDSYSFAPKVYGMYSI